jgi:hypothetical protein
MTAGTPEMARADEAGASAWLPGQFASYAAVPGDPGFSLEMLYYHRVANAAGRRTFPVGLRITAGLDVTEQYLFLTPSYTFADPVLHGQLSLGVTFAPGHMGTSVWATLSGPRGNWISGSTSDAMTGIGDLYPIATLKWNVGPHNFMSYMTAAVPIGAYDPNRLAGLGLGHWALDAGVGYTFLSETGLEFSVTAGMTYNFMNPYTQYQSGRDAHVDWGASISLSEELYVGAVGYLYYQVSGDSGRGATLGSFRSRVVGVGPQIGYALTLGGTQLELGLRGYKEFAAENRPEGWNVWFSVSFSRSRAPPMR